STVRRQLGCEPVFCRGFRMRDIRLDVLAYEAYGLGATRRHGFGLRDRMCGDADTVFLVVQQQCADRRGRFFSRVSRICAASTKSGSSGLVRRFARSAVVNETKHCGYDDSLGCRAAVSNNEV